MQRSAGLCVFIFILTLILVSCGGPSKFQSTESTPKTDIPVSNPTPAPIPPTPTPTPHSNPNPTPTPAPTPKPTPTPSPTPSGATVIDNIEDVNQWLTCGACGNDGGGGATANYSATVGIGFPSEDGSATRFSINASVPYTNAYFYQQHNPIHTQIGFLRYEFDLYIPNGSENAPQAIEFECQQALNGWVYNFAWQADYPSGLWRVFNYGAKLWESSNLPFARFTPGTWHHIVAEYHNDEASHSVFHDALTVDGVRMPVNMRHDAVFAGGNDYFTNAFQLDSNNIAQAYSVYVDRMRVTYK